MRFDNLVAGSLLPLQIAFRISLGGNFSLAESNMRVNR